MALKMKPEHLKVLNAGLDTVKDKVTQAVPFYKQQGLSNKRLRWDALRAARIEGDSTKWMCDVLYPYLNDDHVDSALRAYFNHKE